ncbi:hypothetical protein Pcinc_010454 [Petrolisthes cinctipes]|uniref:ATP synthase-coupling factor 6, mitochondrial n=1 Tax=Petrolisthes cinctipes TaxID=88211 RepID=A0AAE1G5D9_PETCI|nr:hypothetical protein Pcinc_010454 [Petrolisthes cinctipes]
MTNRTFFQKQPKDHSISTRESRQRAATSPSSSKNNRTPAGGPYIYIYISKMIVTRILPEARTLQAALRRNYGASAILMKKAVDPIQQLFVDKIQEYSKKSKTAGGKLVDATPEIEKQLQQELDKVARHYGGGAGVDMTKFPDFKFTDPKVEAS